jgi:dienelactone hydrolase
MKRRALGGLTVLLLTCSLVRAADPPASRPGPGDEMLREYFRAETEAVAKASESDVRSPGEWELKKGEYRRQLSKMLGLWPMPQRTELKPTITGKLDHAQFTVEKLHFQSKPGLYVTGNLYVPKDLKAPAPAVLYVCGHSLVKKDGVSYGNKVGYQHWGSWFARNGYVCLVIDTLQLGEIEGIHHGTYREKMWWWHDRGYTPAGVEAWNSIRALDYLESRPEVDKTRLGVTGRSGGGAYSWYLTALDDRVKVSVPTAGVTDLQNHVVDGAVEGHCDCMYMVNTYRWDFGRLAALAAPRPLMIQNTDKDTIFPLDGVYRVHQYTRAIYEAAGAAKTKLGLVITEGPHKDTQDLQVPALRWFNRHFKKDEAPVETVATKLFEPEQLKVFKQLPADQINTKIQETFVPQAAAPAMPRDPAEWAAMRDRWMTALREKTFAGWPKEVGPIQLKPVKSGEAIATYEFESQPHVPLRLFMTGADKAGGTTAVVLHVLDEPGWQANAPGFERPSNAPEQQAGLTVYLAPRGVGPTAFGGDEKKRTQILRRYALLGQTLEGMQVWDVGRAIQAVRSLPGVGNKPIILRADGRMAGVALYASLFEPGVAALELRDLPRSHVEGPHLLNVLKTLDMPAAVAMAAERVNVTVRQKEQEGWDYPRDVARKLGWPDDRVQVRAP